MKGFVRRSLLRLRQSPLLSRPRTLLPVQAPIRGAPPPPFFSQTRSPEIGRYLRRSLLRRPPLLSRPRHFLPHASASSRTRRSPEMVRYLPRLPQSRIQRSNPLTTRQPRKSGTVVLCFTCCHADVMAADRRVMTTIDVGKYTFGYFIASDNDTKISKFNPYIVVGMSGDVDDAEYFIEKLKGLSSPTISLEELYWLNEDNLGREECELGHRFGILFLDSRKVFYKILKLQYDNKFLKQDLYQQFQVAAIGSGADHAMKIAYPMEHLFNEPYFSTLKDFCIQQSMLNAFLNKASCGGGCDILSWDLVSQSWKWDQIDPSTLKRGQSDLAIQTEYPYAITEAEADKIISEARDDILRGDIPPELEAFIIEDEDEVKNEAEAEKEIDQKEIKKLERLSTEAEQHTAPDFPVSLIDTRVGQITEIQSYPANLMSECEIDVGEESTRTAVIDIVNFIQPEDIRKNQKVCVVCNLRPAKGTGAQAVILVAWREDHTKVQLVEPPASAMVGERVMFCGCMGEALSNSR